MPSVEGLNKLNMGQAQINTEQQKFNSNTDRQQAAQQAGEYAKKGDWFNAYGTMIAHDPENAPHYLGQAAQIDPALGQKLAEAKDRGALGAQTDFGSNPAQIENLKGMWGLKAAQAKAAVGGRPRVQKDVNSPTGFSLTNPADGTVTPVEGYGLEGAANPGKKSPQDTQNPEDKAVEKLKLRPNEDIDSSGKKVMLSPEQQKVIKDSRKAFDSETKDLVKGLDAASKSLELIDTNTPGSRTVEALTTLKSAIGGRVGQQEFQSYGKGMGILNQIDNAISEAAGKGMSPKTQEFMSRLTRTSAGVLSKDFDQHLQNAIERNPEIDPLILKKRLVGGTGPSTYKAVLDKVNTMPPEGQALFNWAHDNPSDPKAQFYLKQLSEKYKLGQ